jgi:hypothetical protein
MRPGYGRGVTGPWPLGHFFRLLGRHSRLVDWEQVASFDEGRVWLNVARDRLQALQAVDDDSGRDSPHRGNGGGGRSR